MKRGGILPSSFRSGGQAGVDIACAVACHELGLDATILFPAGCRQRNEAEAEVEVYHSRDEMMQLIAEQAAQARQESITPNI